MCIYIYILYVCYYIIYYGQWCCWQESRSMDVIVHGQKHSVTIQIKRTSPQTSFSTTHTSSTCPLSASHSRIRLGSRQCLIVQNRVAETVVARMDPRRSSELNCFLFVRVCLSVNRFQFFQIFLINRIRCLFSIFQFSPEGGLDPIEASLT